MSKQRHDIGHRIARRGYNRLAPACGEFMSQDNRATGYVVLIAGRRATRKEAS